MEHTFLTWFEGIYKLLIIFQLVDVYSNEPIKVGELIKLTNQSIQRCTRGRNGKDENNYF